MGDIHMPMVTLSRVGAEVQAQRCQQWKRIEPAARQLGVQVHSWRGVNSSLNQTVRACWLGEAPWLRWQ